VADYGGDGDGKDCDGGDGYDGGDDVNIKDIYTCQAL
jgi:hypothetical protein